MKRYNPHKFAASVWCIRIVLPTLFLLFLFKQTAAENQFIVYTAAVCVVLCMYAAAWSKSCEYCIDDNMIKSACGILIRRETVMAVDKVQYAVCFRLPVQRLFGAASVAIMAAGGKMILFDIDARDANMIVKRLGTAQK